jgi:hypothetical protein
MTSGSTVPNFNRKNTQQMHDELNYSKNQTFAQWYFHIKIDPIFTNFKY